MISHDDVDSVWVGQFIAGDIEQQFVGQTAAFGIFGTSVDYFLEDDMPIGVVSQVGKGGYPFEISPMSVNIPGYYKAAGMWQTNQITVTKPVCLVGFYAIG
jgi:hypothetical protein